MEIVVKASGLLYTILRPSFFMQNIMKAARASQGIPSVGPSASISFHEEAVGLPKAQGKEVKHVEIPRETAR